MTLKESADKTLEFSFYFRAKLSAKVLADASMSSYVAVVGKPTGETVNIFGLTPQEVRYLQVCISDWNTSSILNWYECLLQSKFPDSLKHDSGWNPPHGIRLECACIVILNALGYIGFKVISTAGDKNEYLWTLERNLDMDTQYQAKLQQDYNNWLYSC